ncbi:MAG TPA: alpha/beta hydrolase [Chlamydiales bacterium]|nr:alpha/beta hydrolase [Chlamydiales bacterium]
MIRTILILCFSLSVFAQEQIVQANGIEIWAETFGEKKNPPLLLVMGALCQGILWPTEFCQRLAAEGFYVIRYDQRDSGFSTCFNFEKNPYDLLDMAKDAVALLDALEVEKAHVFGLSMGGPVAELMSVHFPGRVMTLTLIATSCDFRPGSFAYDGLYPDDLVLSRPKEIYLAWIRQFFESPPQTREGMLEERLKAWSILNGSIVPFDTELYREIEEEFLDRLKHPESLANHLLVMKKSFELIQNVPYLVRVPTLVIQGLEDVIFPPDHGVALAGAIRGSELLELEGFGHILNTHFYDFLIEKIKSHSKKTGDRV